MNTLLKISRIVLIILLASPPVLLGLTFLANWLDVGENSVFSFALLSFLSIWISLFTGVAMFVCGMLLRLFGKDDLIGNKLLFIMLLAGSNVISFFVWLQVLPRYIQFRS